jgi:hypothetical protein
LVTLWNDKHHPSQPLKPPGRMGPPTKSGEGFHGYRAQRPPRALYSATL